MITVKTNPTFLADVLHKAQQIAEQKAQEIADAAKDLAPVKSGNLRDSIHAEGSEVLVDAEYAAHVEFGTSKQAAQPFIRPAIEQVTKGG